MPGPHRGWIGSSTDLGSPRWAGPGIAEQGPQLSEGGRPWPPPLPCHALRRALLGRRARWVGERGRRRVPASRTGRRPEAPPRRATGPPGPPTAAPCAGGARANSITPLLPQRAGSGVPSCLVPAFSEPPPLSQKHAEQPRFRLSYKGLRGSVQAGGPSFRKPQVAVRRAPRRYPSRPRDLREPGEEGGHAAHDRGDTTTEAHERWPDRGRSAHPSLPHEGHRQNEPKSSGSDGCPTGRVPLGTRTRVTSGRQALKDAGRPRWAGTQGVSKRRRRLARATIGGVNAGSRAAHVGTPWPHFRAGTFLLVLLLSILVPNMLVPDALASAHSRVRPGPKPAFRRVIAYDLTDPAFRLKIGP